MSHGVLFVSAITLELFVLNFELHCTFMLLSCMDVICGLNLTLVYNP